MAKGRTRSEGGDGGEARTFIYMCAKVLCICTRVNGIASEITGSHREESIRITDCTSKGVLCICVYNKVQILYCTAYTVSTLSAYTMYTTYKTYSTIVISALKKHSRD